MVHEKVRVMRNLSIIIYLDLKALKLSAYQMLGAYCDAPHGQKFWSEANPKCGINKGKVVVVIRGLYGLKSSSKAWRTLFSISLIKTGYKP